MKTNNRKSLVLILGAFVSLSLASISCYAQTGYRKISGTYYNNNENTVLCGCNSPGLLSYVASDGKSYLMTLCFDTEPGSFYQIFDGEQIGVEGEVKNVPCANGQSYLVLYVQKSQLAPLQRMELVPEFIKKLSNNEGNSKPRSPAAKEIVLEGSYIPKWSTKDNWNDYNHCNNCGMLNGNKDQPIIFDRITTVPDFGTGIKLWGIKEGKNIYVTRWEIK